MTNALLVTAVVLCLYAGLLEQTASPPDTATPPAPTSSAENHARDPVGFQFQDRSDIPDPSSLYPQNVVSAIGERWYHLVSELKPASNDHEGVTVVEFKIKRDGALDKADVAERSGDTQLDDLALNAVRSVFPFKPLPKDFKSKSLGFRIHLGYNQPIPGVPCPTTLPGVYQVKAGITAPRAIYQPDPEYSEEGRKAKYQGTAILGLTVGGDGLPYDVCVLNSLGYGLDQKSIEAVKHWKFEPGVKDEHPVPVRVSVEVDFHIY